MSENLCLQQFSKIFFLWGSRNNINSQFSKNLKPKIVFQTNFFILDWIKRFCYWVFHPPLTCICWWWDFLTCSIPGLKIGFADLPNVPYRYVFRQLSSEVLHLHSTPLKSRQSTKIRTTIVWGACECKSLSV